MKQSSLPLPDFAAIAHSRKLSACLKKLIDECEGSISFDKYMNLVLYQPELGYYNSATQKFGLTGDFVTAPEISSLFSKCIAAQCSQILGDFEESAILEIGAGNGTMARDLLLDLEKYRSLPEKYYILEISPYLKLKQKKLLREALPQFIDNIEWLSTLSNLKFKGLVLANEVIDALPVKRFKKESSSFKEMKVGYSKDNFYWLDVVADPFLTEHLKDLESKLPAPFPSNYYSEINVQLKEWLNIIQSTIDEGVILFIDYGYSVLDYYHPSRFDGNLLCHYRHHVHNDPFFYPGLQDITTSVNFSAVAEYAEDIGLNVSGYTNQVYFLFGCGLDDLVVKMNLQDISSQTKLSQELRKLTMPDEMGERFKVIGLTKKYNKKLTCFSKMNQINRL